MAYQIFLIHTLQKISDTFFFGYEKYPHKTVQFFFSVYTTTVQLTCVNIIITSKFGA